MNCIELGHDAPSPVAQDVGHGHVLRDGKSEIEIRPTISATQYEGADYGTATTLGSDEASSRTRLRTASRSLTSNMHHIVPRADCHA